MSAIDSLALLADALKAAKPGLLGLLKGAGLSKEVEGYFSRSVDAAADLRDVIYLGAAKQLLPVSASLSQCAHVWGAGWWWRWWWKLTAAESATRLGALFQQDAVQLIARSTRAVAQLTALRDAAMSDMRLIVAAALAVAACRVWLMPSMGWRRRLRSATTT